MKSIKQITTTALISLLSSTVNANNQDPHVFYLEIPSSINKCLTVTSEPNQKIKTDVDCNSWQEQQWLFMESTNKIVSVSNPDYRKDEKY